MMDQHLAKQVVYMTVLADVLLIAALVGSYVLFGSFLLLVCGLPLLLGFNYLYLRWRLDKFRPGTGLRQSVPSESHLSLYLMAAIFFGGTAYGIGLFAAEVLPLTLIPVLVVPFGFGLYLLRQAGKVRVRPPE